MESLLEILRDPAYRHVVLNHLPVTGLFVAWAVLSIGGITRQRPTTLVGVGLIAATAGSALIVMPAGEEAYPIVYETLDGVGKERLDQHADLAGKWGLALYANAVLALVALAAALWRKALLAAASLAVWAVTVASLFAAFVIADAGGKIRHPEFRGEAHVTGPVLGGPVAMRRLTAEQYKTAIADAFGPEIKVVGRFEPDTRRSGLLAVGSAELTITPAGLERYEKMATNIARQVVGEKHRASLVPCTPTDPTATDASCAESFIRHVGPRLFRRPLDDREIAGRIDAAAAATARSGNFYTGLELTLASMLVAPDFLFRIERTEADPDAADRDRLTDETLATRLAYLIWNAGPDDELLDAAARRQLTNDDTRDRHIDRLLASPRVEDGARAFFSDLLRFDEFDEMSKDLGRYPIYNHSVALAAREQTLRTIVDHLLTRDADYRHLYTTRHSTMTRLLGPLYGVPVRSPEGWEPFEFPEGHPRSGLLTHASLNMLRAHPGRSSPTLRGQFLREAILCQAVPPAPADVEFALFNDDQNPDYKTARDRLAVHSANASCRSCHQLTDPVGLGLENFDGIGKYRNNENGAAIDASGDLDGAHFTDSADLGRKFRDHPRLAQCIVDNLYRYAVGREIVDSERSEVRNIGRDFAASGYRLRPLLRAIAGSQGFRTAPRLKASTDTLQATEQSRYKDPNTS